MNVFTYWEQKKGELEYRYIDCCAEAMKSVFSGCNFIRITPETISQHVDMSCLPKSWARLPVAQKADCIRAVALLTHGGLWVDADTIPIRSPEGLFGSDFCYMQWSTPPRRVLNGYVYSPKGCDISLMWVENITRTVIAAENSSIKQEWTAFGEKCLTPSVAAFENQSLRVPLSTFLPIEVDTEAALLVSQQDPEKYIQKNTICFGLNHSWLSHRYSAKLKMAAFHRGSMLIHRAFRKYVLEVIK